MGTPVPDGAEGAAAGAGGEMGGGHRRAGERGAGEEHAHPLEKSHNAVFVGYMDHFLPYWRMLTEELDNSMLDPYK